MRRAGWGVAHGWEGEVGCWRRETGWLGSDAVQVTGGRLACEGERRRSHSTDWCACGRDRGPRDREIHHITTNREHNTQQCTVNTSQYDSHDQRVQAHQQSRSSPTSPPTRPSSNSKEQGPSTLLPPPFHPRTSLPKRALSPYLGAVVASRCAPLAASASGAWRRAHMPRTNP